MKKEGFTTYIHRGILSALLYNLVAPMHAAEKKEQEEKAKTSSDYDAEIKSIVNKESPSLKILSDLRANYYEIFGIKPNTTQKEIKKKYHKLALKWHPDRPLSPKNKTKEEVEEAFKVLGKAKETLLDKGEKEKYDQSSHRQQSFIPMAIYLGTTQLKNYREAVHGKEPKENQKKKDNNSLEKLENQRQNLLAKNHFENQLGQLFPYHQLWSWSYLTKLIFNGKPQKKLTEAAEEYWNLLYQFSDDDKESNTVPFSLQLADATQAPPKTIDAQSKENAESKENKTETHRRNPSPETVWNSDKTHLKEQAPPKTTAAQLKENAESKENKTEPHRRNSSLETVWNSDKNGAKEQAPHPQQENKENKPSPLRQKFSLRAKSFNFIAAAIAINRTNSESKTLLYRALENQKAGAVWSLLHLPFINVEKKPAENSPDPMELLKKMESKFKAFSPTLGESCYQKCVKQLEEHKNRSTLKAFEEKHSITLPGVYEGNVSFEALIKGLKLQQPLSVRLKMEALVCFDCRTAIALRLLSLLINLINIIVPLIALTYIHPLGISARKAFIHLFKRAPKDTPVTAAKGTAAVSEQTRTTEPKQGTTTVSDQDNPKHGTTSTHYYLLLTLLLLLINLIKKRIGSAKDKNSN